MSEEHEPNPEFLDEDGNVRVLLLPEKGNRSILPIPVVCLPTNGQVEGFEGCGAEAEIATVKVPPWDTPLAICPFCGGNMVFKIAGMGGGISARGPGLHSSAFGRRRKADMLRRHEKLGKTQWDNVEPPSLPEGVVPRNPTTGGPFDPNGPFVKKKGKPKYFDQGG